MKDKFQVQVGRRRFDVEAEGFTEMEMAAFAGEVGERMAQIEKEYETPDSQKQAVLTALKYAEDIYRLKNNHEGAKAAAERKLDELIHVLRAAVESTAAPGD